MASPRGLVDLGPRALARILACLESPRDLAAAVGSCRPFLSAFREHERKVLVQVVINAFGHNLHEAIGLISVPTFQEGDEKKWPAQQVNLKSLWSIKPEKFARKFFNKVSKDRDEVVLNFMRPPFPYDRAVIVRLLRLARTTQDFLAPYMKFYRSMATVQTPVQARFNNADRRRRMVRIIVKRREFSLLGDPSVTEKYRIQRAFIRFEIMCRLFSMPYWKMIMASSNKRHTRNLDDYHKNDYNSEKFLLLCDEDEAEQILSIAAFVRSQYRCIYSEVRRDFEQIVRDAEDELIDAYGQDPSSMPIDTQSVEWFIYHHVLKDLEFSPPRTYSVHYLLGLPNVLRDTTSITEDEDNRHHKRPLPSIDNIACGYGLFYLKKLLMMSKEHRRVAFRNLLKAINPGPWCMETDPEVNYPFEFMHTMSNPVLHNSEPAPGHEGRDDSSVDSQATDLEEEAHPPPAAETDVDDGFEMNKEKQRLVGYYFWDSGRTCTDEFTNMERRWLAVEGSGDGDSPASSGRDGSRGSASHLGDLGGAYHEGPSAILKQCQITLGQFMTIIQQFRVERFANDFRKRISTERAEVIQGILDEATANF